MDHDGIDVQVVVIHVLNIKTQQQAWYSGYNDQKMIIITDELWHYDGIARKKRKKQKFLKMKTFTLQHIQHNWFVIECLATEVSGYKLNIVHKLAIKLIFINTIYASCIVSIVVVIMYKNMRYCTDHITLKCQ